jgi:hypothetical protein
MAKLYANENLDLALVEILRSLQHDVLTTLEAGNANQKIPDEQVLDFAHAQKLKTKILRLWPCAYTVQLKMRMAT